MDIKETRYKIIALVLLVIVVLGACSSGETQHACDINGDLEQFYAGELPSRDAREAAGASQIVLALTTPLAHFEFENVSRFAAAFDELLDVAPDEIRPAVETLSDAFAPMFDWAADSEAQPATADFDRLSSAETNAAGFALEDWADANCSE